jgi:predicted nucleic acid-binding protein
VRLALDTNRYVDLCKGLAPTVDLVATADAVYLPFVVVAELRAGFALGRRGAENERVLRGFLHKDGVHLLLAGDQTTIHYASVFRHLRERGTPIPANDIWIAALVLEHDLVLHARDEHFHRLPQLPRV